MIKVLSYLAFTMLSLLIQFGVMDYIQAKIDKNAPHKDLNITSPNQRFSDILKAYSNKSHALYYQTNLAKFTDAKVKTKSSSPVYMNVTLTTPADGDILTTTGAYDILLFDDNTTATEVSSTSESSFYTTTDFENITELSIFNNKNNETAKPVEAPKKRLREEDCYCDLLYQVCDINCCCDGDCLETDHKMFDCMEKGKNLSHDDNFCPFQGHSIFYTDNLFCVAHTNLPEKRKITYEENNVDLAKMTEDALKWHSTVGTDPPSSSFSMSQHYTYGDPIWILRNGSVTAMDLPVSTVNNYCDKRTPLQFLKEKTIVCNVVIKDLEMFHILKNLEESSIISVTNTSANSSILNCTSVHCTNWTVLFCDSTACAPYNKTVHEPACTDNIVCTNLARKVEYVFYYYESKIINATVNLYTEKVSPMVPFLVQDIRVRFFILSSNNTEEKIVRLSGNPGYLSGLPVIASYESSNYTQLFFSNESQCNNNLIYPENKNGICTLSNTTSKVLKFGSNLKSKCRYIHKQISVENGTSLCESIQNNIKELLGLTKNTVISPLGNPYELKDEHWIKFDYDMSHLMPTYGQNESSVINCYNIITKLSLIFGYADVSDVDTKGKIKILLARGVVSSRNVTVSAEEPAVVLTVESTFVDVTKPPAYEYAGSPQLNIHLPKDFFFPFPSNKCNSNYVFNLASLLLICIVIIFIPK